MNVVTGTSSEAANTPDNGGQIGGRQMKFGELIFDPETLELRGNGSTVRLQPQPAELLELLIAHQGTVVSRDRIRRHLWHDEVHVAFDQSVNTCVKRIRVAMGDSAESPRYIETVPRRGYRFLPPVSVVSNEDPPETAIGGSDHNGRRPLAAAALAGVGALLGLGLLVWYALSFTRSPGSEPLHRVLAIMPFKALEPWAGAQPFQRALAQETLMALCRQKSPFLTVVTQQPYSVGTDQGSTTSSCGADFVLDGQVHRERRRLLVRARLLLASDGTVLWSDSWEGAEEDVLDLQAAVGTQIGDAVRKRLAHLD